MNLQSIIKKYKNKTPEQIDGEDLGPPEFNSFVVTESHRLRKLQIGKYSIENLRFAVGQATIVDLKILLPFVITPLEQNPWASGDFYDGDLLFNVLKVDLDILKANKEFFDKLKKIISNAKRIAEEQLNQFDEDGFPLFDESSLKDLNKRTSKFELDE